MNGNMKMDNQKIENSLNLALEATQEELARSFNLNVGYDEAGETWQIILKYSKANIGAFESKIDSELFKISWLLNEYAIVTTTKKMIEELADMPEIEFIEKPKRVFYERAISQAASCIVPVKRETYGLLGKGVIVGILDSGIDYRNYEFRNEDGTTRILALWDQTIEGGPPQGYGNGTEYTEEQINEALQQEGRNQSATILSIVPSVDNTSHGTEVASIAVGTNGVAPKADILVVKLGTQKEKGFPRTTELMEGLDYLVRKAIGYKKPLAVNISFGNTYGAHDGGSLLERYIDGIANLWKVCICVGTGNEGNAAGHASGKVVPYQIEGIEFAVDRREFAFDLQLWKFYEDVMDIALIAPNGERVALERGKVGSQRYILGNTEIFLYYGEPSPYSILQEIYFEFIPLIDYIDSGIWKIEMTPIIILTGEYNMWLPSYGILNAGTRFLNPTKENTITIPATSQRVISVGAYDARKFTYADFSGRGSVNDPRGVKPDLVAPGVDITVSSAGGTSKTASGTSFATPFVTGSAALLMEWGIVEGNDAYLYGEKMKAFLRKGCRVLLFSSVRPNIETGYGALCLEKSLE